MKNFRPALGILAAALVAVLCSFALKNSLSSTSVEQAGGKSFADFVEQFPVVQLPFTVDEDKMTYEELRLSSSLSSSFNAFVPEVRMGQRYSRVPVETKVLPVALLAKNDNRVVLMYAVVESVHIDISANYFVAVFDANGKRLSAQTVAHTQQSDWANEEARVFYTKATVNPDLTISSTEMSFSTSIEDYDWSGTGDAPAVYEADEVSKYRISNDGRVQKTSTRPAASQKRVQP